MEIQNKIDSIWHYSPYYGDMLFSAIRLHENGESYAALMVLFNATELLLKSIRGNFTKSFREDIEFLVEKQVLTEEEGKYLDDENSLRKIRNIMTHRDAYQFFFEDKEGMVYPFSDSETWSMIFKLHSLRIINVLSYALSRMKG